MCGKEIKKCSILQCDKPAASRGWCQKHYTRWRRRGDPETLLLTFADKCKVSGCDGSFKMNNGYCNKHMLRIRRYGSPDIVHALIGHGVTDEERFWSLVNRRGTEDCWEWQGGVGTHGYGRATLNGKRMTTHRLAWTLAHGHEPQLQILHSCDNKRCVNPQHLREGTLQDNSRDAVERDRVAHGERSAAAKLTEADVIDIRRRLKHGSELKKDIATEYGVSQSVISDIRVGRTWRRVSA